MSTELEFAEKFCNSLLKTAKRKFELYDGIQTAGRGSTEMDINFFLAFAIEELGEIASALNRTRLNLAQEECTDLAHCAMLIALAIESHTKPNT